jgi:hypothetical protein
MTHPFTRLPRRVRWLFYSRRSGRPNLLAYCLLSLVPALPIGLLLDSMMRRYERFTAKAIESDVYATWVRGSLQETTRLIGGRPTIRFLDRRKELVQEVRYRDAGRVRDTTHIVSSAALLQGSTACNRIPANMFGKAEVRVFPACVTYSKKDAASLSPAESTIFENFAAYASGTLMKRGQVDTTHIERALARALGLADSIAQGFEFDVPWVYVASREGAIATFPGTTVIAEPRWEITSRPWFMTTFSGASQLSTSGLEAGDLLTVTYLDVLAKSPLLVRTYLHPFTSSGTDFVLAIDLHLRSERPDHASLSPTQVVGAFSRYAVTGSLEPYLVALALTLSAMLLLRALAMTKRATVVFVRGKTLRGLVTTNQVVQFKDEFQQRTTNSVGAGYRGHVTLEAREETLQGTGTSQAYSVTSQQSVLRAVEEWEVKRLERSEWRLLWMPFESSTSRYVGTLTLEYSSEVLPRSSWLAYNDAEFTDAQMHRYREWIPTTLERNADLASDGRFEVQEVASLRQSGTLGMMPDRVKSAVKPLELLAVRQNRAYVGLREDDLRLLYDGADSVRAVVLSSYLERLLERGSTDFLLLGKVISRLIAFPTPDARMALSARGSVAFDDLVASYGAQPSRAIRRVNQPIDEERDLQPVYDFAIINEAYVCVTHSVAEEALIDASGKEHKRSYRVQGYVSWRKSDLAFYQRLFSRLAESTTTLDRANASV